MLGHRAQGRGRALLCPILCPVSCVSSAPGYTRVFLQTPQEVATAVNLVKLEKRGRKDTCVCCKLLAQPVSPRVYQHTAWRPGTQPVTPCPVGLPWAYPATDPRPSHRPCRTRLCLELKPGWACHGGTSLPSACPALPCPTARDRIAKKAINAEQLVNAFIAG